MIERDYIALLTECRPLAEHLIEVFDLQNYPLSKSDMKIMKSFFNIHACKSFNQLKFLSSQAKITADQFDYLDEMHTEIMLRFLNGTDMKTGGKINMVAQGIQWLDGKINWKIKTTRNKTFYRKYF